MRLVLCWISICVFLTSCEWKSKTEDPMLSELGVGQGIVAYTGYAPLKEKPVNLHFYIPEGELTTMPIVFILPGTDRNAKDYLAAWIRHGGHKKVIAVALEFSANDYSTSEYIEGNMFKNNRPVEEASWSYSIIEPLFEYIKEQTGNKSAVYQMWGHSAGAQFVHRLLTFKSGLHLDKAVAANAGWYTVPDGEVKYPYGLKDSGFDTPETLQRLFGSRLILMLGDQDIDPNTSNLRHTPEADAQGMYRYARGQYYYNEGQQIARSAGILLKWNKIVVQGVAHDFESMLASAVNVLFS